MAKAATKTTIKEAPAKKAAAPKSVAPKAATKAAKKPAKTSAEKASSILTLRNIAERLSETHEMPKRQANEMLAQVVEMIARSLKKGEKIRLTGLGILQVRKRAARTGPQPTDRASRSRSKPRRRLPSGPPRSSRKPFEPGAAPAWKQDAGV
jgi:DNA-binding protein HU-beta